MKYLSLCMPTNGISEWVFPVLDAIYEQKVDNELFEVIVTDNGSNEIFYKEMTEYASRHENLVYKKTDAFLFENQIEALRIADGEFLKFLNHRAILEPGALEWMIETVKANLDAKPVMYFSDNTILNGGIGEYDSFDGFVRALRDFASWTTGVGIWKSDFERIPKDKVYNKISPHSDVLFAERKREKYIIDDRLWSHEIDEDLTKKGRYDLYKAFACEEISITMSLYIDGDISADTFKAVKAAYENRVVEFYLWFNILHRPCSYIIDGFDDAMGIYFSKRRVLLRAYGRRILSISFIAKFRGLFKKGR